ncbi:MAG: hypothetical protein WKF73_18025 [Nocardioidaceae bacterium]
MVLHEGDEVLDGLQAGAFRAGAPAAQVLGCVAGVLVVEGLEVLAPPQGPGGRELGRGAHQLVEFTLLLRREVRVVLRPQPAGVLEFRASVDLLAAHRVDRLAELGGQVVAVKSHRRIRQVLADPGDERGAHVRAGVGDLLWVAPVVGQIGGEAGDGVG